MINMYIDDSGTKNLLDTDQPVYLLSAVCVRNDSFINVEKLLEELINDTKNKIETHLYKALNEYRYTKARASKMANKLNDIFCKDFELHSSQLYRGDDHFVILLKKDRVKIIKKALNIVKDEDLKVITIFCDKEEYCKENSTMDIKDLEVKMHNDMCEVLIEDLIKYLEDNNEQACIIADKGNHTIGNYLVEKLKNKASKVLSSEVLEKESHKSVAIQLADICAHTNYLKHRGRINPTSKSKDDAERFNEIIKDQSSDLDLVKITSTVKSGQPVQTHVAVDKVEEDSTKNIEVENKEIVSNTK